MDKFLIKSLLEGGPVLVAIVFMFMMWIKQKKHAVTNEDILKKLAGISGKQGDLKTKIDEGVTLAHWIKNAHNHRDEDGVFVWHLRPSWLRQQEEIKEVLGELKDVIKDTHLGQKYQNEVLKALVDELKMHRK